MHTHLHQRCPHVKAPPVEAIGVLRAVVHLAEVGEQVATTPSEPQDHVPGGGGCVCVCVCVCVGGWRSHIYVILVHIRFQHKDHGSTSTKEGTHPRNTLRSLSAICARLMRVVLTLAASCFSAR